MSAPGSNLAETKSLLLTMVAEALELQSAAGGSVTDAAAGWLTSQYLVAAREKLTASDGAVRFEVLRTFLQDWTLLRRGDHSAARLQLDRERLAFDRKCAEHAKLSEFWKWTKRPEIKRKLYPPGRGGISKATMRKVERELKLM